MNQNNFVLRQLIATNA